MITKKWARRAIATALSMACAMAGAYEPRAEKIWEVRTGFQAGSEKIAALTLDACGGHFDWELARWLESRKVPATLFMTQAFIQANPDAVAWIRQRPQLFEIANHGRDHLAPVTRAGKVMGVRTVGSTEGLIREIGDGERALQKAFGKTSPVYRGATAAYGEQALRDIGSWGRYPAGYSVSLDAGATLSPDQVMRQAQKVKPGDVLLGHINQPGRRNGAALAAALERLLDQGWGFVTFGQAAGMGMRQWLAPIGAFPSSGPELPMIRAMADPTAR